MQSVLTAVFGLVLIALFMWPWFKILAKAGFSPWLGLLMLVPVVNIVFLFVFAFKEWPIEKKLKDASPL